MSNDTNLEDGSPEDNEVISRLRKDLKSANAAVKTAGEDAIAKVKRVATAVSLMPEGFEGFSDIFESEVDGELTTDKAAEWLAGRGLTASLDEANAEAAKHAADLEEVTNLGGTVAAAASLTPEDSVLKALEDLKGNTTGMSLPEVTAAIDALLNPTDG